MAELLVVAACVAAAWLGVSFYFGVLAVEEAHQHAHYQRCPGCHRRHFVRRDGTTTHAHS